MLLARPAMGDLVALFGQNKSGLFTGHNPIRGSDQLSFRKLAGRVGYEGYGGVRNLTGPVGSGREVFNISRVRVESGHPDPIRPARQKRFGP